jgi:cyanate permease
MGLLSASAGVGGILVYAVNWLIEAYGWRTTLTVLGIGTWAIAIPSSLSMKSRPELNELFRGGEDPISPLASDIGKPARASTAQDVGVRQAMKIKAFWLLALTVTFSSAAVHAVTVHVMPHLISVGFSREMASLNASLLVLVSLSGRFGYGWLANRYDNRLLLSSALFLEALGLFFLMKAQSRWAVALFIVSFGPGYGAVITLRLTLQAQYFGRRAFGAIQGVMLAITIAGTMSSPILAGRYYDLHGDYGFVWLIMASLIMASVKST